MRDVSENRIVEERSRHMQTGGIRVQEGPGKRAGLNQNKCMQG